MLQTTDTPDDKREIAPVTDEGADKPTPADPSVSALLDNLDGDISVLRDALAEVGEECEAVTQGEAMLAQLKNTRDLIGRLTVRGRPVSANLRDIASQQAARAASKAQELYAIAMRERSQLHDGIAEDEREEEESRKKAAKAVGGKHCHKKHMNTVIKPDPLMLPVVGKTENREEIDLEIVLPEETFASKPKPRPVEAKKAADTAAKLLDKAANQKTTSGEIRRASRKVAVLVSGGNTYVEDKVESAVRNTASAERIVKRAADRANKDGVAAGVGQYVGEGSDAVQRNIGDCYHEAKVKEYLRRFNKEAPAALKAVFDRDGDGVVSFGEFDRFRRERGDMSYQQMAALDQSKAWDSYLEDRSISYDEFYKAAKAMAKMSSVSDADLTQLSQANRGNWVFDQNHDGEITLNELRRAMNRAGITVDRADRNHDGRIDKIELQQTMLEVEVIAKLRSGITVSNAYDGSINGSKDGKIDLTEAMKALRDHKITRADQIDSDAEFKAALQSLPTVPAPKKPAPRPHK